MQHTKTAGVAYLRKVHFVWLEKVHCSLYSLYCKARYSCNPSWLERDRLFPAPLRSLSAVYSSAIQEIILMLAFQGVSTTANHCSTKWPTCWASSVPHSDSPCYELILRIDCTSIARCFNVVANCSSGMRFGWCLHGFV